MHAKSTAHLVYDLYGILPEPETPRWMADLYQFRAGFSDRILLRDPAASRKCDISLNLVNAGLGDTALRSTTKLSAATFILHCGIGERHQARLWLIVAGRSASCRFSVPDSVSE